MENNKINATDIDLNSYKKGREDMMNEIIDWINNNIHKFVYTWDWLCVPDGQLGNSFVIDKLKKYVKV